VCDALARLLCDGELRERLGQAGIETAAGYSWERRIDALERFLEALAQPTRLQLTDGATAQAPSAP
jgi:glycosyltransferase involved in cell wall biosynthesis